MNFSMLAKIVWWFDGKETITYEAITNVSSYAEAMTIIERNYEDTLATVELTALEGSVLELTEGVFKELKANA